MALIPGFEYDIFLSYSPLDNAAIPGQEDGWVEQFYKSLNLVLAKRFGKFDIIKITWDRKKTNGNLSSGLLPESGIRKSALLICLDSISYASSDDCKKELDIFYQKAQAEKPGLNIAGHSRILHVLLNNIPNGQRPEKLSDAQSFQFHNSKNADDPGDPVDTNSVEFKSQMQKLGDAVSNLLNNFTKEPTADTALQYEKSKDAAEGFTIYMGEVADTMRSSRKRIITELTTKGFTVLTGGPPPRESAAHEEATMEALEKADMAVHLLDEFPGREITGDPDNWYPQKQTELSLKSGKPQMIWVPEETDIANIEEEKYKYFLQSIEKGNAAVKDYEFVRGPKCTLAQEIINFAEHVKEQQKQKKSGKDIVSVMLDSHYCDQLFAIDLSRILLENKIQPFINAQEDDPRKNINLMKERLSQVNKLIFVYGNVSKEWVRERMSVALELIITNNYAIEDFFIYLAPPLKETNNLFINQRFLKVNVIDSSKNAIIDKDVLQNFLKVLNTRKE
jgi:hypothetical protein